MKGTLQELCRLKGWNLSGTFTTLTERIGAILDEENRAMMENEGGDAPKLPAGWTMLHDSVREHAEDRFISGQFSDGVFAAMRSVNNRVRDYVREKYGRELDGKDLMNQTFSPKSPLIVLGNLKTQSGRDEQLGYMELFAGAMAAIRNPKAHDSIHLDVRRAMHHLFLASLLMCRLDEAGVP